MANMSDASMRKKSEMTDRQQVLGQNETKMTHIRKRKRK